MEAKVYEGQTKEYCRGRCVGAQNRHVFHVTLGLIAVPAILWFGCVVPWYINLALEGYPYAILVPIFSVYLAINTLVALFLCSYTDPGILPRGDHPQEETEEENGVEDPFEQHSVTLNGAIIFTKYCKTCHIYRPPRTVHCRECDSCVERYDHHCPWVGNCVGKRNYRFFWAFVNGASFSLVYAGAFCALQLVVILLRSSESGFWDKVLDTVLTYPAPVTLFCGGYAFFLIWYVMLFGVAPLKHSLYKRSLGGLASYHNYLILRGRTTNEDLKEIFNKRKNPYSLGYVKNILSILFPPWYPRYLLPRAERRSLLLSDVAASGASTHFEGKRLLEEEEAGM